MAYPGTTTNSTDQSMPIIFNIGVVLNFLFSLPLNSYAIWVVITGTHAGISKGFFLLQLAMSEILFSTGALLFPVGFYMQVTALSNAAHFFLCLMGTARPLFQGCLCAERYLAVIHPVLFLKCKPLRYRVAWSSVVWLFIFNLCVIPVYNNSILLTLWCSVGLPLFLVIVFCCLAMVSRLKQADPGERVGGRKGTSQTKRKAFQFTIAYLVGMTVCYISLVVLVGLNSLSAYDHNNLLRIYVLYFMTTGLSQPLAIILEKKRLCS